ncbi:MAG: 50S ribosomal protein L6 [Chloroflexota bacterium]|nr:50S ribosomal protein L6 [Dehalococcoidia bacterium]MDW8254826.1 50S ribosomal protein L6 [Chloroflexota bacterium]
MSRIGRQPIPVPPGVTVDIQPGFVRVKGPKGQLERRVNPDLQVRLENGVLTVSRPDDEKEHRAQHGLTRTLIANMVTGVTTGFTKYLEMSGVGYRAQLQGQRLVLQVGYSHPVEIDPPQGITFLVESPTRFAVQGIDKELVGQVAANIRAVRPPEPYKGKGIRYQGEVIRRKAGKAGKAGGKKK